MLVTLVEAVYIWYGALYLELVAVDIIFSVVCIAKYQLVISKLIFVFPSRQVEMAALLLYSSFFAGN